MKILLTIILIITFNKITLANIGKETGLEIPRYISLKTNDANIRVGPSKNYPIVVKLIIKNYPLVIIEEYEEWRKIEDFKNNIGWIHKSLISGKRTGIILTKNNKSVKILNTINGSIIGEIGNGNIINLNKCKIDWCLISKGNLRGWTNKRHIWGVKQKEVFKINFLQTFLDLYWQCFNSLQKIQNKF